MIIHTIQEFFREYDLRKGSVKFRGENWDNRLVAQLLNDFGIPENTIELIGGMKNELNLWDEYLVLYKITKTDKLLGKSFQVLGRVLSRIEDIEGIELGIQEFDPTRPDGYYILIYGLKEKNS